MPCLNRQNPMEVVAGQAAYEIKDCGWNDGKRTICQAVRGNS